MNYYKEALLCNEVLERLLQAAADPLRVGDLLPRVSASLGIAAYRRHGPHADLPLRCADPSMGLAKEAGRNRYHFFKDEPDRNHLA